MWVEILSGRAESSIVRMLLREKLGAGSSAMPPNEIVARELFVASNDGKKRAAPEHKVRSLVENVPI